MKQRELKFRAWDVVDKVMKDSFTLCNLIGGYDCGYRVDKDLPFIDEEDENNPDTIIMQYTGLKDKDGREVYEGDVVRYKDRYVDGFRDAEVAFDECGWRLDGDLMSDWRYGSSSFEVIGNIYENPELLEQ